MKSSVFRLSILVQLVGLVASQNVPWTNLTRQPERIDTHCHLVPPFYRDLLRAQNVSAGGRSIPRWNVSAHLALKKLCGIQKSVLSISTPGAKFSEDAPIEEGRQLARQLNLYAYNVTRYYPNDFLFFATLTLPDLEGAIAEAIYSLDTLKAAGVILLASNFGELLGTRRYNPLYKVLNDRNATVFIHPRSSPCSEERPFTSDSTDVPPFVVDFLLDTTRAAVNLVYRNVTQDYPNIKFILAHSGGFLPFAGSRAAGALGLLSGRMAGVPLYLEELKKFYVDLAISATDSALPSTVNFFNSSHIIYGSDFPFAPVEGVLHNTEVLDNYPLGNSSMKEINYLNAYGLLKQIEQV